jgi:glycosyltransferase involved in cell wall biosynthesis
MSDTVPVILQVLPRLDSGGVERGTIEITEAISRAGMKALVVSGGGQLLPHINHAGGEHITLPLYRKNPFVIYRNALRLARIIRERNVSLVHARSRAPAWAAYLAAKWTGIPYMATYHGVYSATNGYKKRYNKVMVLGQRVIAISQFVRNHIIAEYQIDPALIRLIPRGVDFSTFGEQLVIPERIAALTRSWRLPDEHVPVIFCPARISPVKGQDVLIEALKLLKDREFLCIIAGKEDGHEGYREALQQQIIEGGLEGKVRMTDPTNYMNEAYQLSEIVVVPSVKPEAFGRVAIEAQALGRVVVAADHGGVSETIIPNETGYLVPPGNAETMAHAIAFALDRDDATKRAMAKFARAHVQKHFSSELMKELTLDVYRELLAQIEADQTPVPDEPPAPL